MNPFYLHIYGGKMVRSVRVELTAYPLGGGFLLF